tara:strand:+ start:102 stop:479 length:378 start_codon:yes stop_codon:yes gene_type:complete
MDGVNFNLYLDNKKVAEVYDDAWGGGYQYSEKGEHRFGIDELRDLDIVLDKLVNDVKRKKDEKNGILIKRPFGYEVRRYNTNVPNTIKKYKDGLEAVQRLYNKAIEEGLDVLNKEYLFSVGVIVK